MPLPVIANTVLVTQKFDDVGHERHQMACVFGIQKSAGTGSHATIADEVAGAFAGSLWAVASAGWQLGETDIIALDGTSPTQTVVSAVFGQAGGHGTGNAMPNALCQVVTWQTDVRGKSHRGRSYIPMGASDQLTDPRTNLLTSGAVAALQTEADNFLSLLNSSSPVTIDLVVVSRKLGTASLVTSSRANAAVGIQRRRYERVAHA